MTTIQYQSCSMCQFPPDVIQGKVLFCLPCFATVSKVPGTATLIPTNPEFITSSKFYRVPKLVTRSNSVGLGILKALRSFE